MPHPILLVCLAACGQKVTTSPDPTPDRPVDPPPRAPIPDAVVHAPSVDPAVVALNQRTSTGTRAQRCAAAFELFDKYIKPNSRPGEVAPILIDRNWITVDNPVDVLGGWVPVEMTPDDQTFVVYCDAKPDPRTNNLPWSDWVIYGRIATRRAKGLHAFLSGPADLVFVEFALAYPDGRIEQYKPSGRKSLHM